MLPILGAVPDGAMVLFSCLGDNAAEQINVGVGALAGSTIMLITLPWFLSIMAGRVNLDSEGQPIYKSKKRLDINALVRSDAGVAAKVSAHLFQTGVTAKDVIQKNGKIMVATSMVYLIIQIPAFIELAKTVNGIHTNPAEQAKAEKKWVLVSIVACFLLFALYLASCVIQNNKDKHDENSVANLKEAAMHEKAIDLGHMSIGTMFAKELETLRIDSEGRRVSMTMNNGVPTAQTSLRLESFLRKKFCQYDKDGSGKLETSELRVLFSDLGSAGDSHFKEFMNEMDKDHSGNVSYNEFKEGLTTIICSYNFQQGSPNASPSVNIQEDTIGAEAAVYEDSSALGGDDDDDDDDDDDEEEEEIPEEFAALPPKQQMRAIIRRSLYMMSLGTVVVLLVSDPAVDVLSDLGTRVGINSFIVSFLLAPMASNASELVAAFSYAKKKTASTMAVSLSTLEGAGIMNNTFTTAIFFIGIYINPGIEWKFSAETIGIISVQLIVGLLAQKKVMKFFHAFLVLSLYPISLIVILLIKNNTGLQ